MLMRTDKSHALFPLCTCCSETQKAVDSCFSEKEALTGQSNGPRDVVVKTPDGDALAEDITSESTPQEKLQDKLVLDGRWSLIDDMVQRAS